MRDSRFSNDLLAHFEDLALDSGVIVLCHLLLIDSSLDQRLFFYRVEKIQIFLKLSLVILQFKMFSLEGWKSDVQRDDDFHAEGQSKWHFFGGSL